MATAHFGEDRSIRLVQNFSTGRASSLRLDPTSSWASKAYWCCHQTMSDS